MVSMKTLAVVLLALAMTATGCSKNDSPAPKAATQATEVKPLAPSKGEPGANSGGTTPAQSTQSSEASRAGTVAAITTVEPATGAPNTGAPTSSGSAVTNGYSNVRLEAWPQSGTRLQLKINGMIAGVHDQAVSVDLDPLLKSGANNTITFAFNRPGSAARLSVKTPGSDQWLVIVQFLSTKEMLEDNFQVPFVGGKK